jgi:hypothetical protein
MNVVTSVFKNLPNYRVLFSDGVVFVLLKAFTVLLICVTLEIVWLLTRPVEITDPILPTK